MGLSKDGFKHLESICRSFLWGVNERGLSKTALIAWDFFALRKGQGGLDIIPFQLQAKALKMRHITRILKGDNAEWTAAVRYFIKENISRGRCTRRRRQWSAAEAMLLNPLMHIRYSKTTAMLMECWRAANKALRFEGPVLVILATLTIDQLFELLRRYTSRSDLCYPQAKAWFRKIGVNCLMQLKTGDGNWSSLHQLAAFRRTEVSDEMNCYLNRFQTFLSHVNTDVSKLEDSPSWCWETGGSLLRGWSHSSITWRSILSSSETPDISWQERWDDSETRINWESRWKLLWSSKVATSAKVWLWRVMRRGFFTGKKALTIGVSEGHCPRCSNVVESFEHVFWSCPKVWRRWNILIRASENTRARLTRPHSLLGLIDCVLTVKDSSLAPLILLAEITQATWADRAGKIFRRDNSFRPLLPILVSCEATLTFYSSQKGSEVTRALILNSISDIQSMLETLGRLSSNPSDQVPTRDLNPFSEELNSHVSESPAHAASDVDSTAVAPESPLRLQMIASRIESRCSSQEIKISGREVFIRRIEVERSPEVWKIEEQSSYATRTMLDRKDGIDLAKRLPPSTSKARRNVSQRHKYYSCAKPTHDPLPVTEVL
ncbi:hypothetical protein R1sor_021572 [Riccia sorocarpa]|uniref:Reverse transcriptase zinc-binding domain-containing protein n=1 Tax=Riccia sorocarpa TaxID=122646 RepID=A0ABD3GJ42_9MARC